MRYEAKVDWWIGTSLVAGLVLPIFSINSLGHWVYGVIATTWALVFGFCYPQSYETTAEALVIRAGLRRRTIPYGQISAVCPSSDSRSSAALSLDRVQVEYTSGDVLIALKDQEAFFADLAARAPQLSRCGQALVIALK